MGVWATNIGFCLVACFEYVVFGNCKWFLFCWAALLWTCLWLEAVLPDCWPGLLLWQLADEVVWSSIESLALVAGGE